jgi:hypothetical protein
MERCTEGGLDIFRCFLSLNLVLALFALRHLHSQIANHSDRSIFVLPLKPFPDHVSRDANGFLLWLSDPIVNFLRLVKRHFQAVLSDLFLFLHRLKGYVSVAAEGFPINFWVGLSTCSNRGDRPRRLWKTQFCLPSGFGRNFRKVLFLWLQPPINTDFWMGFYPHGNWRDRIL